MRFLIAILMLLSTSAFAFPRPTGYVNDYANLLSTQEESEMEAKISQNVKKGGWEIAVVTVKSLDGKSVETYANELFNEWGIGKKGKDDGVLLLLSLEPRKIRIEVGYGAEENLSDGKAGRIIRDAIVPRLKTGDIGLGLSSGVNLIMESQPRILTQAEKVAIAESKKEQLLQQMLADQESQRKANSDAIASEKFWRNVRGNIWYTFIVLLLFLPIWGPLTFLFVRKKLREKSVRDEEERLRLIEEEKERKRLALIAEKERKERERKNRIAREKAARIRAEKERIARAEYLAWRKANPEKAKEKDRQEAIERKRIAEEERIREKARKKREEERRKRQREEDEERRRRNRRNSSYGGYGGSSGGFGGFSGGSSGGGGSSSSW